MDFRALANAPLRPSSCALVVAFTSILEEKVRAVRALSACLAPGGSLVAFLFHPRRPASGGAA